MVVLFGVQFSKAAQASTYTLTLDPTFGSIAGSGTMDVTAPGSGSGISAISDLTINIDGANFNLTDEIGAATATFSSGMLTGINYVGASVADFGLNLDFLGTQGLMYAFLDIGTNATLAEGTISAVDPPTASLPTTIVMFATGLIGLAFLTYRRKALVVHEIA